MIPYTTSLTQYKRRKSREVNIGGVPLGGSHPVRVQSMTTVDTMDTEGSVEQSIRMIDAGCEYVRITAPNKKEAQNLEEIKRVLRERGYTTPLIADIHFTPNAAEVAATIVEKVRINPGNYADKKKFEVIEYDDVTYQAELDRIKEKFLPLVRICKEQGTAMRIGTNHGSLSDRIMSRYGDTPLGMVESALEFLRICEEEAYYDIVLSMKASNPQVMVQAYRLLVAKMDEEGLQPYPLHLGVTEAGEAEDGRIKSAMGIGTLLEDGLGDTVRVSLTEAPEAEIPVAQELVNRYHNRAGHREILPVEGMPFDPYAYQKRTSQEVHNVGGSSLPRVMADLSGLETIEVADLKSVGHYYLSATDKWTMNDLGADYVYTGQHQLSFMLPNGLKQIADENIWQQSESAHCYPYFTAKNFLKAEKTHPVLNFVGATIDDFTTALIEDLAGRTDVVLVLQSYNEHLMAELRRVFFLLNQHKLSTPAIIKLDYGLLTEDQFRLFSATDAGGLFIDGFGDGVWLTTTTSAMEKKRKLKRIAMCNDTSFGILQAARVRVSKTEYISCPSCGRTLFDLQETTAMIRKRTDHLKGVKIGIMGCIVNGPGEMADADYGYVGSGPGKITLYRGQNVVKRNVPSSQAVDELIEIIREDGNWISPAQRGKEQAVEEMD